jgi:hypothetical protein
MPKQDMDPSCLLTDRMSEASSGFLMKGFPGHAVRPHVQSACRKPICPVGPLALQMEAVPSSEMPVNIHYTA